MKYALIHHAVALLLTTSAACVTDVYLGQEPDRPSAHTQEDASEPNDASSASDAVAEDDASPRVDAAVMDAGADTDATAPPRSFCPSTGCDEVRGAAPTCQDGAPAACWPGDDACTAQCPPVARCSRDGDPPCDPETDYCNVSHLGDTCNARGLGGYCVPRQTVCGPEWNDPVCGCDNTTYRSACHAAQLGMSLASTGSCRT